MFLFLCAESYPDDKFMNRCILRSNPVKFIVKKNAHPILNIYIYACMQSSASLQNSQIADMTNCRRWLFKAFPLLQFQEPQNLPPLRSGQKNSPQQRQNVPKRMRKKKLWIISTLFVWQSFTFLKFITIEKPSRKTLPQCPYFHYFVGA